MTERKKFEAWAVDQGLDVRLLETVDYGHVYADEGTEYAWLAWLAALATPAPAQPEGEVKMPTTADEAALMLLLGHRWLLEHAPERLTDAGRAGAAAPAQPDPLHVANERGEGWQPIETAPERGIILLGLAPNEEHEDGYVSPGYWMESDEDGPDNMGHDAGFVDVHFDFFSCARSFGNPTYQHKGLQPTHWMPLPPPPAAPKEKP